MQILSFDIDGFSGPMDVLLSLIAKHKLNIYDIAISQLLEQYLDYWQTVRNRIWNLPVPFWRWAPG